MKDSSPRAAGSSTAPINVAFVGAVAALSGVLFGFDASIAAAVGAAVNSHFHLVNPASIADTFLGGMGGLFTDPAIYGQFLQGLWVGMVPLGALFGALCGGFVANRFGRRMGLLFNAVLFVAGILISALSPNFAVFLFSRLLMGLAVGNSAVITPMYMAEVAPPNSRGRILFLYQLSIVIGILVSFLVGVVVDTVATHGNLMRLFSSVGLGGSEALTDPSNMSWRIMIGVGLIPALLFLLGMFRMPRSPRWLMAQGREEEAHSILSRMVGEQQAHETLAEIRETVGRTDQASLRGIFTRVLFPVILLGFFLQFFQQATGINADMYYGPQIFVEGGFSPEASMWAQVAMGAVNLVVTIVSIFLVDRLGRRKLMFFGLSGIVVMLCVQAWLFRLYAEASGKNLPAEVAVATAPVTGLATGSGSATAAAVAASEGEPAGGASALQTADASAPASLKAEPNARARQLTYLIFVSVLVYIAFFAVSAGPLCWLMISEIFPMRYRGIGMSIAVAANWFVDYLVTQMFPLMKENLGISSTFLIYAAFTAVALALAYRFLPETKGVPLEEIERNIYAGKRLRDIGA